MSYKYVQQYTIMMQMQCWSLGKNYLTLGTKTQLEIRSGKGSQRGKSLPLCLKHSKRHPVPRPAIHSELPGKVNTTVINTVYRGNKLCVNTQRRIKERSHRSHKYGSRGQGMTPRKPRPSPPVTLEAEAPRSCAFLYLSLARSAIRGAASLTPTSNQPGGANPTS